MTIKITHMYTKYKFRGEIRNAVRSGSGDRANMTSFAGYALHYKSNGAAKPLPLSPPRTARGLEVEEDDRQTRHTARDIYRTNSTRE